LLNNKETKQRRLKSLPKILRRVAYPVEPLGFNFVSNRQPTPLFDGIRDRLGKKPSLPGRLDDGQENELQCVRKTATPQSGRLDPFISIV
jgi:hypothetical protein